MILWFPVNRRNKKFKKEMFREITSFFLRVINEEVVPIIFRILLFSCLIVLNYSNPLLIVFDISCIGLTQMILYVFDIIYIYII